jgi:DNA-directed RNA polymerase specialized sigma subunit
VSSSTTSSNALKKPRSKKIVETVEKVSTPEPPKPIEKAAAAAISKNQYFTKTHEAAILKYATSTDRHEKSVLYITLIQPAFNEMVDKIVFTYKFTSLPNIEDLKEECKIWLTTILDKFDVSKGSKAFSYFSVITKNWFIHKVKKNSNGKEVGLEDITQEFEEDNLFVINEYEETREKDEFWGALWQEMDTWSRCLKKQNEKIVYDAVKQLVSRKEELEIFNKKAIYLYIREMTGLSTKQIVSSLNKFKNVYFRFVRAWNSGELRQVKIHGDIEKYREVTE